MSLHLRRIVWDRGSADREDYSVVADGEDVGRIYRTIGLSGGEAWNWSIYTRPGIPTPPAGSSGRVESLDAAKVAFKAQWDKQKGPRNGEAPPRKMVCVCQRYMACSPA